MLFASFCGRRERVPGKPSKPLSTSHTAVGEGLWQYFLSCGFEATTKACHCGIFDDRCRSRYNFRQADHPSTYMAHKRNRIAERSRGRTDNRPGTAPPRKAIRFPTMLEECRDGFANGRRSGEQAEVTVPTAETTFAPNLRQPNVPLEGAGFPPARIPYQFLPRLSWKKSCELSFESVHSLASTVYHP